MSGAPLDESETGAYPAIQKNQAGIRKINLTTQELNDSEASSLLDRFKKSHTDAPVPSTGQL